VLLRAYSDTSGAQVVTINGVPVLTCGYHNNADGDSAVAHVSAGDVVKIAFTNGANVYTIGCYFIPPKHAKILIRGDNPVIEPGYDYSTEEKPVLVFDPETGQTRQKRWLGGKGIWEKTIPWTSTALAVGAIAPLEAASVTGATNIIGCEAVETGGGNGYVPSTAYITGGNLVLRNDTNSAWALGCSGI
jgi:hypothetical protein